MVPEIFIVLHQIKLLALLPTEMILSVFVEIEAEASRIHGTEFDGFFAYYKRFWLGQRKPEGFSVYGMLCDRTDNHMESFHRDLNKLLAKNSHPNCFIGQLKHHDKFLI